MRRADTSFGRFREKIWGYYRAHGRNLPWRKTKNPYRILVSEVMLQQTQVSRVVPKYAEFIKRFPDFSSLSRASTRDVLRVWQGLGYNRRALALKKLSGIILKKFKGEVPKSRELLEHLPSIGHGTAGAVLVFAFNTPLPFIETNIRRTFIDSFFGAKRKVSDKDIMPLIERTIEKTNPREWFYALMDYGSMLGKKKKNPNRKSAGYRAQSPFRGSSRELRGKIIKLVLSRRTLSVSAIERLLSLPKFRIKKALRALEKEKFIAVGKGGVISLQR